MKYTLNILAPLLLTVSSCVAPSDPEFDQKVISRRTDCKGDEIVGVWVSALKGGLYGDKKMTILIRPDGSGMQKLKENNGKESLTPFRWQYVGYGKWAGIINDNPDSTIRMFYSSDGQLAVATEVDAFMRHSNNAIRNYYVCVRSSDEAAVKNHLNARQ